MAEQFVGVSLLAIGFTLWTLARFQLGKSLAVTAQAKKLVTSGLYSKIRNPIYVFSAFLVLALALTLQRPIVLVFLVVLIPVQIMRARKEAAVLEAKFGKEYRRYRQQRFRHLQPRRWRHRQRQRHRYHHGR